MKAFIFQNITFFLKYYYIFAFPLLSVYEEIINFISVYVIFSVVCLQCDVIIWIFVHIRNICGIFFIPW